MTDDLMRRYPRRDRRRRPGDRRDHPRPVRRAHAVRRMGRAGPPQPHRRRQPLLRRPGDRHPGPTDRDADYLGDDPLAAFRATTTQLTEAFDEDGFAERPVSTPFGDGVGAVLVAMRTNEFLMHGWDLAVATGQPRDFDPEVVAAADGAMRSLSIPRGEGGMFAAERPAPAGAGTLDALAAFMGREVPA